MEIRIGVDGQRSGVEIFGGTGESVPFAQASVQQMDANLGHGAACERRAQAQIHN